MCRRRMPWFFERGWCHAPGSRIPSCGLWPPDGIRATRGIRLRGRFRGCGRFRGGIFRGTTPVLRARCPSRAEQWLRRDHQALRRVGQAELAFLRGALQVHAALHERGQRAAFARVERKHPQRRPSRAIRRRAGGVRRAGRLPSAKRWCRCHGRRELTARPRGLDFPKARLKLRINGKRQAGGKHE